MPRMRKKSGKNGAGRMREDPEDPHVPNVGIFGNFWELQPRLVAMVHDKEIRVAVEVLKLLTELDR